MDRQCAVWKVIDMDRDEIEVAAGVMAWFVVAALFYVVFAVATA